MTWRQLLANSGVRKHKRNIVDYDTANVTSNTEASELLQKAEEFRQLVEAWIKQHHPKLIP